MIDFELHGFKELERKLLQLAPNVARKHLKRSVRRGAAPIRDAARRFVRVKKGILRKAITIKERRTRRFGEAQFSVGPDYTKTSTGHLVEFGTAPHVIIIKKAKGLGKDGEFGKKVEHPGSPAKPFLRPAFDTEWRTAIERIRAELERSIELEASKQ